STWATMNICRPPSPPGCPFSFLGPCRLCFLMRFTPDRAVAPCHLVVYDRGSPPTPGHHDATHRRVFMPRLKRCDWVFIGCLGLLLLMAVGSSAFTTAGPPAEEPPIVYRGARIYTVAGPVIEHGVLIVHKGKIAAVGPMDSVAIPPHAII